jgi:hypothetical protein
VTFSLVRSNVPTNAPVDFKSIKLCDFPQNRTTEHLIAPICDSTGSEVSFPRSPRLSRHRTKSSLETTINLHTRLVEFHLKSKKPVLPGFARIRRRVGANGTWRGNDRMTDYAQHHPRWAARYAEDRSSGIDDGRQAASIDRNGSSLSTPLFLFAALRIDSNRRQTAAGTLLCALGFRALSCFVFDCLACPHVSANDPSDHFWPPGRKTLRSTFVSEF